MANLLLKARRDYSDALDKSEAILARLVEQKRSASASEQRELDALTAKIKDSEVIIRQIERLRVDRDAYDPSFPPDRIPGASPNPRDFSHAKTSGPVFRDVTTGDEYRAVRHGERLSQKHFGEEPLSPGKYLRGVLLGEWDGAEAERRAYSGLLGTAGGFMVPSSISSMVVDYARNKARVIEAGALTIQVPERDVTIVRVLEDVAASYKQENEAATDSQLQFSPINLSARTLVCYATLSQEVLQDAANLDDVVLTALGESIGLAMDKHALFGTGGGGQPLGLYENDLVNPIEPNANGFTPSNYDEFSDAIQAVENANGNAVAAIYSPRTAATLRELKESTTDAYLAQPAFFTDLKRYTTNQVPNDLVVGTADTCSAAFVGDFSQLLFAVRQQLRIDTSHLAGEAWQRYQFKIRATLRYDCIALRPAHFAVIRGIKA